MTLDGNDDMKANTGGPAVRISEGGATISMVQSTRLRSGWYGGCSPGPNLGGAALILAGTGAGQIRRIVATGAGCAAGANCTGDVWPAPTACERSFQLASAFDVTPDASSIFQMLP